MAWGLHKDNSPALKGTIRYCQYYTNFSTFYYAKSSGVQCGQTLGSYTKVVQVSGFEKISKNFDQSDSWKIKFHWRHQIYTLFESACSTDFKTGLSVKIVYVVLEKFWVKNENFQKMKIFFDKNSRRLLYFLDSFYHNPPN